MHIFDRKNSLTALVIIIFFTCGVLSCKSDPFPKIVLPIHPNAISPKILNDKPVKGAKAVAYNVSIHFPASTIIEFYNRELLSMGYVPLNAANESRPLRKWSSFDSRTGEFEVTEKPPGGYIAHWVDNSKETWVWLMISYQYDRADPAWDNTAIVSCNMARYSAYEEVVRKMELMKEKLHNK